MSKTSKVSESSRRHAIHIVEEHIGCRLDRLLVTQLPSLTRTRMQALIRGGCVALGGEAVTDPNRKAKRGDCYHVTIPPPEPAAPVPQAITLDVVYEDRALIVIDKPPGLVVHPAPGNRTGTLVNALIAHCGDSLSGIGGERRPGIVHRLDKDTTGLLVVAKTDEAHHALSAQFAAHGRDGALQRAYLALVWGVPARPSGRIDAPLGRSTRNRTKMAVVAAGRGRAAITRFRVVERYVDASARDVASLLRVELETGRTHQIRVHMAHAGHPVIGDRAYGAGFKASAGRLEARAAGALHDLARQALHAAELGFRHPVTGQALSFKSELPGDMARLCRALAANGAGRRRPKRGAV